MKVLFTAAPAFFDPQAKVVYRETPPLSVYSLAAILKAAGHEVSILDPFDVLRGIQDPTLLEPHIQDRHIIAVSANSGTWPHAKKFIEAVSTLNGVPPIVLGGVHPTLLHRHVLETTEASFVVRGEGERTLPDLLSGLENGQDLSGIDGLSYKVGGEIFTNRHRQPLTEKELSEICLPDFEQLRDQTYFGLGVETSRGCPFRCVFCSIGADRFWRGVGAESILKRVRHARQFLDHVSEKYVFFVDDCFTSNVKRLEAVCPRLARIGHDVQFGLEARATDLCKPRVLNNVSKLAVKFLQVGVECGYDDGLKRIKKGLTTRQVIEAARVLAEAGLINNVKFSYIIGFPWEDRKLIETTIRFAFEVCHTYGGKLQISWLYVFPGSELYLDRQSWGIEISEEDYDLPNWQLNECVFRRSHPNLTADDIQYVSVLLSMMQLTHPDVELHSNVWQVEGLRRPAFA